MEPESGQLDVSSSDRTRAAAVGVSRRFSVGHMLVGVALFASLFGLLQVLRVPPIVYVPCVLFCLAIPLGQVFLYQGRNPRRASSLVGSRLLPVFVLTPVILLNLPWIMDQFGAGWVSGCRNLMELSAATMLCVVLLAILGYLLGYVLGTISAGVFLLLDRRLEAKRNADPPAVGDRDQAASPRDEALLPTGIAWLDWIAWSPLRWSWQRREHVWRNSLLWTLLFALPLLLWSPTVFHYGGWSGWLLIVAVGPTLLGLGMAGLFFAGWRATLFFAVAGIACTVYPMMLVRQIWPWGIMLARVVFRPGVEVPLGIALAILSAGAYGWVRRWQRDRHTGKSQDGSLRSPLWIICTVMGVLLALLILTLHRVVDSPRNRVILAARRTDRHNVQPGSPSWQVDTIVLTGEQANDPLLRDATSLQELMYLGCFDAEISVTEVALIARFKNLVGLNLADSLLSEQAFERLADLQRLQVLGLRDTNITDEQLTPIAKLGNLRTLYLEGTRIGGADAKSLGSPSGLAHLAGLGDLRRLSLAETKVEGPELRHLRDLGKLEVLDLSGCRLGDDGLADLPPFPKLKILKIADTKITDQGLAHLARFPSLESLDLSRNAITDAGCKHLQGLPLVEVELSGTEVTPQRWIELDAFWRRQRPGDFPAD